MTTHTVPLGSHRAEILGLVHASFFHELHMIEGIVEFVYFILQIAIILELNNLCHNRIFLVDSGDTYKDVSVGLPVS